MRNTKMTLDVVYDGKVYELRVVPTDRMAKINRTAKQQDPELRDIDTALCEKCGSLVFNDICMNRQCTNSVQSAPATDEQ